MKRVVIISILCFVLVACAPPTATPTQSAVPSAVVVPTQETSPTPSSTPTPTATHPPTLVPSATASPTLISSPTTTPTITPIPTIELLFTGAIVPGRCVQAYVDEVGNADYIYENVAPLFQQADLTVGTLNASLTDYPPTTGCVNTFVLVGRSLHADAMARAGIRMMSVATNHIKNCGLSNCGDRAFLDTLGNLQRVGIEYVGAGMNLAEGMKPIVLEIKGVKFAFISLGEIERLAFASETTPGIAYLTDETLQDAIAAAKQVGDVVVVMPHWGPEYSPIPNPFQRRYAQIAVDAGADLVIGNHTHVIQGYHMIGEIPVYYGLGNFVFDQTWSEETAQGLMVRITFSGTKITGQQVIPVTIEKNGRVNLADIPTAQRILDRIQKVNDGLK